MELTAFEIHTRFLTTQITCLEFVGPYLIAGEGSFLQVFKVSQCSCSCILKYKVFKAITVHGIRPCNAEESIITLCIFGGKCLKILQLSEDPISLTAATASVTFQDWIWDVKWLCTGHIAIVLAQNYVIMWDPRTMKQQAVYSCEERCILYCGLFLGDSWTNGVLFCGTVFKEILIWCPAASSSSVEKLNTCRILHRLQGHDGVIFSVAYNIKLRKLCSSSDDRSIQIWHHHLPNEQQCHLNDGETSHEDIWKNSTFSIIFKLYGHEARVWKVLALHSCYLSAGEDSMLCIWNSDKSTKGNRLSNKIMCHDGSSIRSLCVNPEETLIATGGGNGGIKMWHLSQGQDSNCFVFPIKFTSGSISAALQSVNTSLLPHDYPREVNIIDEQRLLIMTNEGILLCYNMHKNSYSVWLNDAKYKSYSVMDVMSSLPSRILIAVGDLSGQITVLSTAKLSDATLSEFQTVNCISTTSGKILALKIIDFDLILACGACGKMRLWKLDISQQHHSQADANLIATLELPPCKQRWFSAATFISSLGILICGCRDGSIHVYHISAIDKLETIHPIQSFYKLHGPNGVTALHFANNILHSTGRDGFLQRFQIVDCKLKKMHKSWITGCPKWISGMFMLKNELLISGFHTDNFILWSEDHQTTLLKIPCGGGHRSWSFTLHHNNLATYSFIKGREVTYCKTSIERNMPVSVKAGFHIRQLCSVKYLFTVGNTIYCATTSEDTTVKIVCCHGSSSDYICTAVHTLKSHISSVKSFAICEWPNSQLNSLKNVLLVTVGGRAQLICWRLQLLAGQTLYRNDKSVLVFELASHMLHPEEKRTKKPWEKQAFTYNPETRYMDVVVWNIATNPACFESPLYAIAVACSDSYLRVFSLNTRTSKLNLLIEDPLHEHCMLKIAFLRTIFNQAVLITTATDGKVIFWDMSHIEEFISKEGTDISDLSEIDLKVECQSERMHRHVITSLKLHQLGVTALAVVSTAASLPNQQIIIATGGDDAAICITVLEVVAPKTFQNLDNNKTELIETHRTYLSTAHSAQVTGVYFISSEYLVTASVDHRICVWHFTPTSNGNIDITLKFYKVSNIADIASLTGWPEKDNVHCVCVGGNGLEICDMLL